MGVMSGNEDRLTVFTTSASAEVCLRGLAIIRRRALWLFLSVLLLPITFFTYAIADSAGKAPWSETTHTVILFGLMGLLIFSNLIYVTSTCPRCRKGFFVRGAYGNAFARRCLNCRLRRSAKTAQELND